MAPRPCACWTQIRGSRNGVGRGRKIGLILGYQNLPQVHDQYGR
jgi:hypothetical protein